MAVGRVRREDRRHQVPRQPLRQARPARGQRQPSIEAAAHDIAAARTGPGGIIGETNDIDANGYWTSDNYEALLGLAGYEYLAKASGDTTEASWAAAQYDSLLKAVNPTLSATITANHLSYIPCSMVEPNTANRCTNPEDANWAAPGVYFNWAWNAAQLGAPVTAPGGGTMAGLIDKTLSYGFGRAAGLLPRQHLRRLPGRGLLLDRLQRRLRRLGSGQQQLPRRGHPRATSS